MQITIICVGKLKEKFFCDAVNEYAKRLSRYCKLEIIEVADEKTPDSMSDAEENIIKKKEAERIQKNIKDSMYIIALAIEGKQTDSIGMAEMISSLGISGKSSICFIIGGSLGLHHDIIENADSLLSFSKMTFPHQLMRVILLEQIYRSYRIINHEPYHK